MTGPMKETELVGALERAIIDAKMREFTGGFGAAGAEARRDVAAIERLRDAIKAGPTAVVGLSDDGYKIGYLQALREHRLPLGTELFAIPNTTAVGEGR